jgi:hypothetical protein
MKYLYSDFVLLIFNCEKYREKALKQKETWLNNFTLMPYFHVIGNPKLTTNYTFDFENKVLYVKVEDDYNSLPKKAIVAYEAIQNTYIFKYIFKTDDDQNLTNIAFLNTIQNILLNNTKKIHYAGHIIDVDTPYVSQYCKIHPELPENLVILQTRYCSGRFYVLSELSIQVLISKKEAINKEYLEDYAIGLNLDPFLKENMLNIQTDKYFVDFLNF